MNLVVDSDDFKVSANISGLASAFSGETEESGTGVTCEFNVTVIAPAPVDLVLQNQDCGCGDGADGLMMMPMTWIGIRQMRRRRGMRKTRRGH